MKKIMKRKSKSIDPPRPLTSAELDSMGPWMFGIDGLPPELQAAVRRMGRPRVAHPKEKVTVRLDHEVLAALRSKGRGWQTHMNTLLRQAVVEHRL